MGEIHKLEPHTMAYFYSIDSAPKFAVDLCNDRTLEKTLRAHMFPDMTDPDTEEEIVEILAELREKGFMNFEDGWIAVRIGLPAITEFLMEKINDLVAEQRFETEQWFAAQEKWDKSHKSLATLRAALVGALGDKAPEIANLAAAS